MAGPVAPPLTATGRREEAKAAMLGAMFTDERAVYEIVALDSSTAVGEPIAWLLANICDDPTLAPGDRATRRVRHSSLDKEFRRVGFGDVRPEGDDG